MSEWRAQKNARSLARLQKALPSIFPAPVLSRALSLPFIPPTPRLAVDRYWRVHPIRADRLARALAAASGAPAGWTWRLGGGDREDGLPATFRLPPAPYREAVFARGPGVCCVCGQSVYRFGWHRDLWRAGVNRNASWHAACVIAWDLWCGPGDFAPTLKRLQGRRCAQTGVRLWKTAEVDHKVPLFRVWREHRHAAWPELLAFWGVPNLQVINRNAHAAKCAAEADDRRKMRSGAGMTQANGLRRKALSFGVRKD